MFLDLAIRIQTKGEKQLLQSASFLVYFIVLSVLYTFVVCFILLYCTLYFCSLLYTSSD
jgi:hypothetical protein